MRIVHVIFLAIFLLCIAVQYNDPDALLWMLIYGFAAVLTGLAIAGKTTFLAIVGLAGYVGGFIVLIPGWDVDTFILLGELKMTSQNVEVAREAVGLLVCGVWMGVLSLLWLRKRRLKKA